MLIAWGEGLSYGVLRAVLRVVDEAVDLDAIAADVEPAQPFVSRSYTAALQEVGEGASPDLRPHRG